MNMHRAHIKITHPRPEVIEGALRPESMAAIPRTSIRLDRHEEEISLDIESIDLNGLRAAINSYLRWMDMASRIAERSGD